MDAALPTPALSQNRASDRIACAIVALLTLLALWPVTTADFTTWDDNTTVAGNPNLNPPTLAGLAHHWMHPAQSLYVPITYTASPLAVKRKSLAV